MRESLMYGSVRGTRGNSRPYRDAGNARFWSAAAIACRLAWAESVVDDPKWLRRLNASAPALQAA